MHGLKQAAKEWHKKLQEILTSIGFSQAIADPRLYTRNVYVHFAPVYLDHILLMGDRKEHLDGFEHKTGGTFEIRVESRLSNFHVIKCDLKKNSGVHLHSSAAIKRILCQFNLRALTPFHHRFPPV